jgi:glycosyltransferase involved in cell wall biosynthesis
VQVGTIHNRWGVSHVGWLQRKQIPHVWALVDYWPFCRTRNLLIDTDRPCSAVGGVCDNACGQRAAWQGVVNGSPTVTLSEPSAAILRRNGIRADYVAELGVDTTMFQPGPKAQGRVYSSSAWGEHPVKGAQILRAAIRGTPVDVNLITGLPRERVAEVLAAADIYVFPSIYEETFGLGLCEAMASGCACVASDVAGARAQIEDGVTGLLVPPRDPGALRAALERLLADPVLRRRLGAAARAHVEQDHSLDAMARRWESVYQTVLGG